MTGKEPARPIHSNIRVLDERRSIDFYRRALGLEEVDRIVFDDFTLVFLGNATSGFELELTVNHGRTEPYGHSSGYGHFAVSVANIKQTRTACEAAGLEPTPIKELLSGGRVAVRFFFLTDPDGYKVEVVHRQGRYR